MIKKIISLTNKIWSIQSEAAACSGESALAILAKNRNIDDLDSFISTSLKETMPDPLVFVDMERAANRIVAAIKNNKKIAILGDYDVDGVASVSLFIKFLKYIGAEYIYFIPHRLQDGYGLNTSSVENHRDCLIIAVDCGSSSLEVLEYARDNHIDIVVIDHHRMVTIPENIIVNPYRPDESGKYRYLCAAGLVFLCIVAVNRILRDTNFYEKLKEPNLIDYLDLVALATVCDVVELTDLNRAFVSTGIKVVHQRKNLGIDALLSLQKNPEINAETIAFIIGPKLNAAGRMTSADASVRLLTTEDSIQAKELAQQLINLNRERQILEQEMVEEAYSFIDENLNFICAYNSNWHLGIIGIIAGRLREKYNRPAIVISTDSNGIGKASCRSTEEVDISDVIRKGIECGVIISGGGHAMAAGFSLDMAKINDFLEFLKTNITHKPGLPEIYVDCKVPLECISVEFLKSISILEPFGVGNRFPKFIIPSVKIVGTRIVGENHLAFSIVDKKGNFIRGISFRSLNSLLGNILLNETRTVDVLGTLSISSWNRQVNFQLEDIFC